MLIISLIILLLAVTSSVESNYNYIADYVKFNRIVFIIFILGAYLAYNSLDIDAFDSGIGIYGGVFKITVLSQVFDIILFITGGIVTILTCFAPYNFYKYNESNDIEPYINKNYIDLEDLYPSDKVAKSIWYFKSDFKEFYYRKLLKFYPYNDSNREMNLLNIIINSIKKITNLLPDKKYYFPFLVEKRLNYSKLEVKEYSFLLLYTVLGGSLLISSQNLISLYLSLELQSFTLYILSASQIKSFRGTSGGLKYFLLGGLSSGFILLGCSLLYAYTGTLNIDHIFMIYSDSATNYYLDPCLLVLFSGLLFKVSAAPFHNWAPDVYSDVPTYSTTWLIIIAKLSIFILMLLLIHNIHSGLNLNNLNTLEQNYSINLNNDIQNIAIENSNNNDQDLNGISSLYTNATIPFSFWNPSYSSLGLWTNVLTLSAFFSLIIGTVLGLSQSRTKRLFAYSTITHVGFLLLALSINSIASIDAFIFYLIQYTITNLNLFFILIAWGYLYSKYYLEKDFIPIRYLKLNPYSWKDIYIEPSLVDFSEFIKHNIDKDSFQNSISNEKVNIKVNNVFNQMVIKQNSKYYDFNKEDSEWIYTPVPFLTNFKGMHFTDPYLAFCLAVSIFSLAGNIYGMLAICRRNIYIFKI
jgi:NADH:ubiquinone oxidoreductase subunit 2 (subunit N)